MIGAIVAIVAIVAGAASHSLATCALASSPKKTSIYLYKKEKAVADTQALTIETIAPIGRDARAIGSKPSVANRTERGCHE